MKRMNLNEQAQKILEVAEQGGNQLNFLFTPIFSGFLTQIETAERLKKALRESDVIVSKEYVKGRANVYTNPIIKDYNATMDSLCRTSSALMKILGKFNALESNANDDLDPLLTIINGDNLKDEI